MGVNNFTYDKAGLTLTEQAESCRLTAYQDPKGTWTIGYGHTGPAVHSGLTITQAQAEAFLAEDTAGAAACVNQSVTVALTQGEFDALVDFVFNFGPGAFRSSTLLKLLNSGDYVAAAAQFESWDKIGQTVSAGLLRRRKNEEALFNPAPSGGATTA